MLQSQVKKVYRRRLYGGVHSVAAMEGITQRSFGLVSVMTARDCRANSNAVQ